VVCASAARIWPAASIEAHHTAAQTAFSILLSSFFVVHHEIATSFDFAVHPFVLSVTQ
jgi:hypothetical protein